MTRTWVCANDTRWIMICDQPGCVTRSEPFPPGVQPELSIFAERGWFIARAFGDICPTCRAAGVVPSVPARRCGDRTVGDR